MWANDGASSTVILAIAPGANVPSPSVRRRAAAPPTVAARTASSAVSPMSRTPSAMQNAIDVV